MARYIARFMKDVLGENGHEKEICQRSLEIEAANKARAADAAKIKFCEAESVRDWSLHADRVQITEPQIKSNPIISKLIDAFGNWRKHRQEIREIRDLNDDEFANLAYELRISPADLDTFVRQGPYAVDELPKLLTALGIDEKALSRTQPLVLRDMVRVCASCQQKHQCDRDLDAGTSAQHYQEYCLNASTIDALDPESEIKSTRLPNFIKIRHAAILHDYKIRHRK